MSTSVRKAISAPVKPRRPVGAPAIATSTFKTGVVEQATDLGDGYLIVKIASSGLLKPLREDVLPTIPEKQLRRVLARLTDVAPDPDSAKPALKRAKSVTAEDNTWLLDEMEQSAMERRQALHDKGQLLTSAQICERLGISRQALSKAVRDRRMFWIGGPRGAQWYPSFFSDDTANRRDLEQVSVVLGDLPGAVKWQFFTTPKHSLKGQTPVGALGRGASDIVLRTAAEAAERYRGR